MSVVSLQPEDNGEVSRQKLNDNFASLENDLEETVNEGAPLATDSTKGRVKLSAAPADAAEPTAVGDNDPRMLSGEQKTAFAGLTGAVLPYAGASAPTGFLLCDGAAVSRSTYSELFSVIGTTYGVGDGDTTFNLPNLKGRVPVGLDAAQTEFDALGETGGAKTHTLTTAQIPSHTHSVPYHPTGTNGGYSGSSPSTLPTNTGAQGGAAGGGEAHNNLQPYIALNYVIKI